MFRNMGLQEMVEGKDYITLDMVFSIVSKFTDRGTGHVRERPMTKVRTAYSDLIRCLKHHQEGEESDRPVGLC